MSHAPGEKKRGDEDSAAPIDCDAKVISSGEEPVASEAPVTATKNFLHPGSGLVILGLDWLLFSDNLILPGVAVFLNMFLGFVFGGLGTALCQRRLGDDSRVGSLLKGVIGGILVGIPYPIVGTVAGATILTLSGLSAMQHKAVGDVARTVLPKSGSGS